MQSQLRRLSVRTLRTKAQKTGRLLRHSNCRFCRHLLLPQPQHQHDQNGRHLHRHTSFIFRGQKRSPTLHHKCRTLNPKAALRICPRASATKDSTKVCCPVDGTMRPHLGQPAVGSGHAHERWTQKRNSSVAQEPTHVSLGLEALVHLA